MDEMNLNGTDFPELNPTTDIPETPDYQEPAAIPESYGDSIIPDPVAAPESYGDSIIPDPVASPESYSDSIIPDPAAAPASYGGSVIPDPVASPESYGESSIPNPAEPAQSSGQTAIPSSPAPQTIPTQDNSSNYSGHYSWNGSGYVENAASSPSAQQQEGYNAPYSQQPVYSQNANGDMNLDPQLEKRANTVQLLGILGIVFSIVSCGCACVGPILSIVGLVKASGMNTVMHMMSEESKKKVSNGKICCWIGIIISVIGIIGGLFTFWLPFLLGISESL